MKCALSIEIQEFIVKLSEIENQPDYTNLYFGNTNESCKRRRNLNSYLNLIANNNSKILILGEAPGYKGCKNTGIAFACEHTLKSYDFLKNLDFETINEINFEKENTATIVWSELSRVNKYPLLWNIFPFHPHKKDNEYSNRTPSVAELKMGLETTKELIKILEIDYVICVGRKAETKIKKMQIKYDYVRHPSYGGEQEFIKQINNLLK